MPMTWTEPEAVVEHNGVTVYHTYKDGDYRSEFWYTLDQSDDDWEGESAFDVRDLGVEGDVEGDHKEILRAAIDAGILKVAE